MFDYTEVQTNKEESKQRALTDFDFFAALCLPDVMEYALPVYYIAIANMLIKNANDKERTERILKFALGLPRGFIKTTFIKILVCYFIVHDLCDFALIICATEFHAENIISDIDSILSSPNITELYGSWHEARLIDTKAIKRSYYHKRPVILAGLGAGSSLRGINIDNRRPDFLICDDMQTKENDDSPAESLKLFNWFVGTLLKAVNLKWCLVAYIGNMYSEGCILFKLKLHPHWKSLITGCILADGESLWPEMHSVDSLYESFKHDELLGLAHIWFAEMMNDPIQSRVSILSSGNLPPYPFNSMVNVDGAFIVIDPAGMRRVSDQNVIAVHQIIDKKGVIAHVEADKMDPETVIKKSLELAILYNVPLIGIEATGYQISLKFWMDKYLEDANLQDHIIVVPLETKKRSKDSRIIAFFNEAEMGNYYIKREEDRQKIIYQALEYKVGKKNNKDDLLDGCAYGLDIREEYWDVICTLSNPLADSAYGHAQVIENNTPF